MHKGFYMPEANVLSFARPVRTEFTSKQTPLYWSCSPEMLSGGTEKLITRARHAFEVSPGAIKFLRDFDGEIALEELRLIQPALAFDAKTMLGFEEVRCQAEGIGLMPTNPVAVLSWAILSFNQNLERGEINVGMAPKNGHYLVFVNRGTRCKPRLVLQPHSPNRKYPPRSRWIYATQPTH